MRKAILALAAALVVAVPVSAQTADEIIAKHHEALGGLDKIKAVKTARMTGKMTIGPGIEAPVVIETKRPNSLRIDITFQGMTISQGYDGTKGWMVNPLAGSGKPEEMPADQVEMVQEQADMDGPLVDYKSKGHKVELAGKEQVEGADAHKLTVTMKNGVTRTFYIDAEHFLTLKEESTRKIRGTETETETVFGDYKEVDGMMFPHAIDGGPKGNPQQRQKITVEKIELNVPLDDARFKMPEAKDPAKK